MINLYTWSTPNGRKISILLEELEVKYGNESLEIGFNSRYLIDITQQIHGETARFALSDSASPTVVKDVTDESALYVLMPMRV